METLLAKKSKKINRVLRQTGVFHSCLTRQVKEAVRIERSKADCIMNSKAENCILQDVDPNTQTA